MYGIDTILNVRRMAFERGMGITDISRETGLSRNTIYKFLNMKDFNNAQGKGVREGASANLPETRKPAETEEFQGPAGHTGYAASREADDGTVQEEASLGPKQYENMGRASKLDPYKPFIIARLLEDKKEPKKQRHTSKKILELIQKRGYDGGHTIVYTYIRQLRKELGADSKRKSDGYLPLAHYPGEAQADFGKARFEEDGLSYDGSFFVLSFPYSNAGYLQLHFGENLECVLESMKALFEHLGGVPPKIWFDNAPAIVTKIYDGGERVVTKGFSRFKEHYGFEAVFMNPESGFEKGNVERKVCYLRNNVLVPVPKFTLLSSFNEGEAFERCEKLIREDMHYRFNVPVRSLFEEDKKAFQPLPSIPFDTASYVDVHTDKWGLFKLHNGKHIYSSAPDHYETDLLVKITAAHVEVMERNGSHIVTHPRLYGGDKDRMEHIDFVPYLKFIARKPRSFFNVPIREMMPSDLVLYLDSLPNGERGRILSELAVSAVSDGFGRAVDILYERLKGMFAPDKGKPPSENAHGERLDIPYALERNPARGEGNV